MEDQLRINFVEAYGMELQGFFYEATRKDYSGECIVVESNENVEVVKYERDDWTYVDECFGNEPFSGIVTIFYEGIVCFSMVYGGKALPLTGTGAIYECLKQALMATNEKHPWRGPNSFEADNGLRYTNMWHGDINKFYGQEKVGNADDDWLYECHYRGGIINIW